MGTLLKGFNAIDCVKLKKKSVSPVPGKQSKPIPPHFLQGVMDANC